MVNELILDANQNVRFQVLESSTGLGSLCIGLAGIDYGRGSGVCAGTGSGSAPTSQNGNGVHNGSVFDYGYPSAGSGRAGGSGEPHGFSVGYGTGWDPGKFYRCDLL